MANRHDNFGNLVEPSCKNGSDNKLFLKHGLPNLEYPVEYLGRERWQHDHPWFNNRARPLTSSKHWIAQPAVLHLIEDNGWWFNRLDDQGIEITTGGSSFAGYECHMGEAFSPSGYLMTKNPSSHERLAYYEKLGAEWLGPRIEISENDRGTKMASDREQERQTRRLLAMMPPRATAR